MGYTTDFEGRFNLDKPLNDELCDFLVKLNETRRMSRKLPDKYGVEGEFFVDGGGDWGQDREDNIIDYNSPPANQPGLWCKWIPTKDRHGIEWDGAEKFRHYVEWLEYIIKNFLKPNNYILNGTVKWQGERYDDAGIIEVKNNTVRTSNALGKYFKFLGKNVNE